MIAPVDRDSHVAVVGLAGRFAGAPDLDSYWRLIRDGGSSIRELSAEELLAAGEDPQRLDDPAYVRRFGKLDGAEDFDAKFFGYAPVDAVLTDPQHRIFLETCWQAMENAGYPPTATEAAVGVYAGCGQSRYWALVGRHQDQFPGLDDVRLAMVAGPDHLCLRVSHKLGLTGPSMTVLTTCSSALVAVHLACQALLVGDCDMALAGGVSVRVPARGALARAGSVLSPDGVCRAFDAKANGTVFGDGAGVVVLKRFADAVADDDHVRAVILGSAVNNDGRDRVGYGAPGVSGQAAVIRAALRAADVTAESIDYVETHGTGTSVGDPIEVAALIRAFGPDAGGCVLGAVKPNIGHTDAASGIAGLLKTILALEHRVMPPVAHFERPNPLIEGSPFTIPTEAVPWPDPGRSRRAGVSSFGIGATNAHVVVEEPPPPQAGGPPRTHRLLVLSATTVEALDQATAELAAHLAARPELSLDDVAHTLQVGRAQFPFRRFAVVTDSADAVRVLTGQAPDRLVTGDGPVGGDGGGTPDGRGPDAPRPGLDLPALLAETGRRWSTGGPLREEGRDAGRRHRVPLPTYPFQRRRYVVEATTPAGPAGAAGGSTVEARTAPTGAAPTGAAPSEAAPIGAARRGTVAPARSGTASHAELTETVALLFGEMLRVPDVDGDDDFFTLGGDSLIAVGLIARIEETFGVAPSPETVFTESTPAGVARVVGEMLAEGV